MSVDVESAAARAAALLRQYDGFTYGAILVSLENVEANVSREEYLAIRQRVDEVHAADIAASHGHGQEGGEGH